MNDITILNSIPELATLDKQQVAKITERLPEYHRGKAIIGHSTSQTSYSLQTMNMICDSPLSRMKQCLAQIGKKYDALREAYFKVEEHKLEIKELMKNKDEKSQLKIRELETLIDTIGISMENALRQIGMFQDMYDSIKENNGIPDNWSEADFEKQEIENMIRRSFRLCIQDIQSHGRISQACIEFFEQLGIHPTRGEYLTGLYLNKCNEETMKGNKLSIRAMHNFLDDMVKEFGQEYNIALERLGLDGIGSEEFMAKGVTKPQ
jgi:hypothetical protein